MIHLREARLTRGRHPVLDRVNLDLHAGEIVAVVGANGSGKTTLLDALAGLQAPAAGEARWHQTPMRCLGARALARRRALLTQKPGCAPDLTVAEVVAMGRAPWGALRFDAAARRSLERVDLAIYADTPIGRLSGGEQQRVHLARALAQIAEPGVPRAFLLDEPTNHLDPAWGWRLAEILDEEARAGALIVIVLHDVGLASTLASRLLVLGGGRVLGDGTPPEALRPEAVRAAFGLEATFLTVGGRARAVLHPPEVP